MRSPRVLTLGLSLHSTINAGPSTLCADGERNIQDAFLEDRPSAEPSDLIELESILTDIKGVIEYRVRFADGSTIKHGSL